MELRSKDPVSLVRRAQIVLLAPDGKQNKQIAEELGIMPRIAALWRGRFLEQGLAGLERDAPRSGRKPSLSTAKVRSIVRKTLRRNRERRHSGARARWRKLSG